MLKSLFGELGSPEDPTRNHSVSGAEPDGRFAARSVMESVATEVNERGLMIDRHLRDLVVSGSPAQAMRDHFAATRTDVEPSSRLVTLFDPSRIWASAVIKALSDAGGMPIERLHLRDQHTLSTLAMIERTTVVRRFDDALKVYHADVRAPGRDNTEIPLALMERSHLTAVIVGSMQPHAIDDMLGALCHAAREPAWRCPALLFMLPPGASWIANKVSAIDWPDALRIEVQSESLASASGVWNAVLAAWDRVKKLSRWGAVTPEPEPEPAEFPIKVADLERYSQPLSPSPPPPFARTGGLSDNENDSDQGRDLLPPPAYEGTEDAGLRAATILDPLRVQHSLARLLGTEGMLACALVDSMSGLAIAQEFKQAARVDVDAAIAGCAQVLRSHRLAARAAGFTEPIDEVIVTTGDYQQLIHRIARHPDLFIFVLMNKHRINLALGRLKILEAEKAFR